MQERHFQTYLFFPSYFIYLSVFFIFLFCYFPFSVSLFLFYFLFISLTFSFVLSFLCLFLLSLLFSYFHPFFYSSSSFGSRLPYHFLKTADPLYSKPVNLTLDCTEVLKQTLHPRAVMLLRHGTASSSLNRMYAAY